MPPGREDRGFGKRIPLIGIKIDNWGYPSRFPAVTVTNWTNLNFACPPRLIRVGFPLVSVGRPLVGLRSGFGRTPILGQLIPFGST